MSMRAEGGVGRCAAAAAAVVVLLAAAGRAAPVAFDNSCGTHTWRGYCHTFDPPNCYGENNWNTGTLVNSGNCFDTPPFPGPGDDVFIGNVYVVNDSSETIRSLTTTTLFRNEYIVDVSDAALYGGPVTGYGAFVGTGTHVFTDTLTPDGDGSSVSFYWPCRAELHGGLTVADGASLGIYSAVYNHSTTTWSSNQAYSFLIDGAYGGGEQALFTNTAGGQFLITGNTDMHGIIGVGHFANAGLVRKQDSVGVSTIWSEFKNLDTGRLVVASGTLRFKGETTFAGRADVAAGSALVLLGVHRVDTAFDAFGPGPLRVLGTLDVGAGATATVEHLDMRPDPSPAGPGYRFGQGVLRITQTGHFSGQLEGGGLTVLHAGATGSISGGGTFTIVDGTTLDLAGAVDWAQGPISVGGGGSINVLAEGSLECNAGSSVGGYAFTTGVMTNAGLLRAAGAGTTTFALPFTNTGTVSVVAGTAAFTRFTQHAGSTDLAGGAIDNSFQIEPLRFQGGTLRGSGGIEGNVENTGATVAPGFSIGTITIGDGVYGNSYVQGPGGTLEIELGASPAEPFDQVILTDGPAALDGTLRIVFLDEMNPPAGTFDVLIANSVSGEFAAVDAPPGVSVAYLGDRVQVTVAAPACVLDYNQDTVVNPDDLGDFITDYYTDPPIPGPEGYAIACPENDPPYDVGYKAAYTPGGSGQCNPPFPDNLGDWITDYFAEGAC